jgi:GT2 family glycosyltransferase
LVVDNAPVTDQTRAVVASFSTSDIGIEYVVEPRVGVTFARNRALQVASTEITAWIDDDEIADRFWLAELARGFDSYPDAAAVGGIMVPAELKTTAQVRWEQYGGHHKHRGFQPATFSRSSTPSQSPLFPLPPFGAGGNMAFKREPLRAIGDFDPALGTGTLSMAGEDTLAFSELLLMGRTLVYQPSAITHHFHRGSHAELRRQMFGYGVGLTAFYTSLLLTRPTVIGGLAKLGPTFLKEAFGRASMRSGHLPRDFPADLRWANRRGLAAGPARYLAARMMARRRGRQRLRPAGGERQTSASS